MTSTPNGKPVAIASDHAGFKLKEQLKSALEELGFDFEDLGTTDESSCDYPDFAHAVATGVVSGRYRYGVLVCGTGIGMAIVANKVPGVRAACCHDTYSAERARKSNDAQVLCLGAQIVGPALARDVLVRWLESEFGGGRSTRKVEKIKRLDARAEVGPPPSA